MPPRLSWVDAANTPHTDFPLENLPFGVFTRADGPAEPRIGVAIGDRILDLRDCSHADLFDALPRGIADACRARSLNALMALGRRAGRHLRARLHELLADDSKVTHNDRARARACLVAMEHAAMRLPVEIGDYTDFYASIHHATHVGQLFRPDRPPLPANYKALPLAYHGRASSIVESGQPVRRPRGQWREPGATIPSYGASRALDYELEVGFYIGSGNASGDTLPIERAEDALFGACLVNDWSARDMQAWESQPLGPFLSKSFATTVSPWVVTMDALEPFRTPAVERTEPGERPLDYLRSSRNDERGGIDITLEVSIVSAVMRSARMTPLRLGSCRFRDQYWTPAQMVTHHASNGCPLRAGDLLASGTVSGDAPEARGCLLELTRRGTVPFTLPTGESRTYLEDGDEVILRGWCEGEGLRRIGFGECTGMVRGA